MRTRQELNCNRRTTQEHERAQRNPKKVKNRMNTTEHDEVQNKRNMRDIPRHTRECKETSVNRHTMEWQWTLGIHKDPQGNKEYQRKNDKEHKSAKGDWENKRI